MPVQPRFLAAIALMAIASFSGCASRAPSDASTPSDPAITDAATMAVEQTRGGLSDAALSPLEDVNLRREPIPDTLKQIETPYSDIKAMRCADITVAVLALDADLGPDWDAPGAERDDESRAAWAARQTSGAALGAVSSQARSFIPFRGLVRDATGANAHADRVRRAYRLGSERRAFLKGVGLAKGCPPPASPWPGVPEDQKIIYRDHVGQR